MCGRYAIFGPVSLSRKAKAQIDLMEFDLAADLNQREARFNVAPTQLAPVVAWGGVSGGKTFNQSVQSAGGRNSMLVKGFPERRRWSPEATGRHRAFAVCPAASKLTEAAVANSGQSFIEPKRRKADARTSRDRRSFLVNLPGHPRCCSVRPDVSTGSRRGTPQVAA